MEYTLTIYKQNRGLLNRTFEGHKCLISRREGNQIYLKCVLFCSRCKSSAKLSQESNLIILLQIITVRLIITTVIFILWRLSVKKLLNILEKIYSRFSIMSLAEIPKEEQLPLWSVNLWCTAQEGNFNRKCLILHSNYKVHYKVLPMVCFWRIW